MNKKYNNLIEGLLEEIGSCRDSECFNLSVENEKKYIVQKAARIESTINFLDPVLGRTNKKNHKINILDIGTSPFTFIYNRYFNANTSTIDLTDLFETRCRTNKINFKKCDLTEEDIPLPENEFDIIIFTEVFEHLMVPPRPVFDRISRVLKDDGILVFSTPNLSSYFNIIKLMLGKPVLPPVSSLFEKGPDDKWIFNGGHWRKYTMGELINILNMCGFKIIKHRHIMKPFLILKTKNPIKFIKRLSWNIMAGLFPASQFNLVLARKKLK